jgi:predicted nucleic acid-binding Zn ribbon protein
MVEVLSLILMFTRVPSTNAMQDIQALLDRVLQRVSEKTSSIQVMQPVWAQALGPLTQNAELHAWDGSTVTVYCRDEVWAATIRLHSESVLARLRERLGERAPHSMQVITHR